MLVGGASLAGRRLGHQVGGWLVALPLTSGPVAFFLASDQGASFAAGAAVGMLAATASQVAWERCVTVASTAPRTGNGESRPARCGPTAAAQALDGLLLGRLAAAVFFLVLALMLRSIGLPAFALTTAVALIAQGITLVGIPRQQPPAAL